MKQGLLNILLFLFFLTGYSQDQALQFRRFDINDGLSSNQIKTIFKDSKGYIWIGTTHGLNRFDGHTNKVFLKIKNDSTSLHDNVINAIYESFDGKLWIDTPSNISIYNPKTGKFSTTDSLFNKNIPLPRSGYSTMFTDSKNNFWLIHGQNGIYCYDPNTDSVYLAQPGNHLMHYNIESVSVDKHGKFWLINSKPAIEVFDPNQFEVIKQYTNELNVIPPSQNQYNIHIDSAYNAWIYITQEDKGAFCFDTKTGKITRYHSQSKTNFISHNNVSALTSDKQGNILLGSDHGGLNVINKETGKINIYENIYGNSNSLSQNSITSILADDKNIVWIGTYKKGINFTHPELFNFEKYKLNPLRKNWLCSEDINTFAEDKDGNLWIGTNGSGLMFFNRNKKQFTCYTHNPNNTNSLSSDVIVDLCFDHNNTLWIGTYTGGLNSFDGKNFKRYTHNLQNKQAVLSNNVWAIFEDSDSILWIGSLGEGLAVFDRKTQTFRKIINPNDSLTASEFIMSICEDKNHTIWMATSYGVNSYNKQTKQFKRYLHNNSENSLSSNSTLDVYADSQNNIWVATLEGINILNQKTQNIRTLSIENGLPDNVALTILESNDNNIWTATPRGLANIIIQKANTDSVVYRIKNYDEKDGLHGIEFNEHAALKTKNGDLIFGGSDGFSIFKPENLLTDIHNYEIFLSELKVNNRIVEPGNEINNRVILKNTLAYTNKITLHHSHKTFSITFASINYLNPDKIIYHYTLEGFNSEWLSNTANHPEITYTNLNPGNYILKAYSSDIENMSKSETLSLQITVLPPFWRTKLAYSIYLINFILIIFYTLLLVIRRERNKFALQQERTEATRQHEMDMLKLKFFTNISHEFRTPLTLIISPIERLIKNTSDAHTHQQLKLINRNAKRLLNLVNQLLDFRKLEVQGLTLDLTQNELVSFCRDTVESFSDMAETRNIQLSFESNVESIYAWFDYDKIEKIIFNLLSNAFKFTSENGNIAFKLSLTSKNNKQGVNIEVKDSGIGIPLEKQNIIFERFVQNIPAGKQTTQGSGIGLSLTREFTQMHKGSIHVKSEPGKGSLFIIDLPLENESEINKMPDNAQKNNINKSSEQKQILTNNKNKLSKILLVEDNPDIRFYLKDNLKTEYRIYEAQNGEKAWELIPDLLPDLIVSDIMMPQMDGIELCKLIKSDKRTSHIPVILLTARTSDQHKYEGLETGADDYITKPFNFEILKLRIAKLIEQRINARKQFQKNFELVPSEIQITSLDEKFLGKVKELTEQNMHEPDFSVEKLSREIGISRAHLYNKLSSLTGKTPIEYIRIMRIRRAAQLLEKSQLTVMEVAYKIGFNDPRYFTKHFKSEYKMTPTQYIKKHAGKSSNSNE